MRKGIEMNNQDGFQELRDGQLKIQNEIELREVRLLREIQKLSKLLEENNRRIQNTIERIKNSLGA